MSGYQKVTVMGNLGADPEMRYTSNGTAMTTMRVAVSERYTVDGEKKEKTEWFSVVAWRQLAELCGQYLEKGRPVLIEGKMATRSWDQNGEKKYRTELVADRVVFIGNNAADAPERDELEEAIV